MNALYLFTSRLDSENRLGIGAAGCGGILQVEAPDPKLDRLKEEEHERGQEGGRGNPWEPIYFLSHFAHHFTLTD